MTKRTMEGCYARLCGLRDSCPYGAVYLPRSIGQDYIQILETLRNNIDDSFDGFNVGNDVFYNENSSQTTFEAVGLISKINQLIRYLEMVHQASNHVVEIGSIYNSIKDTELKGRCGDLLSASGHFDRVINQATQVLEERVRQKLPLLGDMFGMPLLHKAINPEPSKSMLVFSENPSEQEGYFNLFKGLMGTFRNQSHHKFFETVTREQALQICAFIDNMLAVLESANANSSN